MNLHYGQIAEVFVEDGWPKGRVRVHGVVADVSLALTPEAQPGDRVLVCDGVALSKVHGETTTGESNDVSRDSR